MGLFKTAMAYNWLTEGKSNYTYENAFYTLFHLSLKLRLFVRFLFIKNPQYRTNQDRAFIVI